MNKTTRFRGRQRILKRDGYRCVRCQRSGMLTIHHINPRSEHGSNALDNLCSLCELCHNWVESNVWDHLELLTYAGIMGSYPWPEPGMKQKTYNHGDKQEGDRADIWTMWVANGRKGAAALVKKYGCDYKPERVNGKPVPR